MSDEPDGLAAMTDMRHAPILRLDVSVRAQRLEVVGEKVVIRQFPISTAANGHGCVKGSYCTPLGMHRIMLKIGHGCQTGTVFVCRRPTGEVFSETLREQFPGRDWILSRILWLCGMEPGLNRGGELDSARRLIYIHGTADEHAIGRPTSKGCIRMRNDHVIELFELVPRGLPVRILL